MRTATLAAAIGVALLALTAEAKVSGTPAGFVIRYPSGDAPDPGTLQLRMSNPAVSTIVFEKGTQIFSSTLFVFRRNDLTLCGATGNPKDVVIESSARSAFQIEQAQGTVFRGITIRSKFVPTPDLPYGIGVFANAVPDATKDGYVDDTSIERCNFESYVGVQASVRTRALSVADSKFTTTERAPGSGDGGVGVLWEDGPTLSVTRCKFTTARDVSAISAIFVKGAQSATSAGDRAKQALITRNEIDGDYGAGIDLADVKDAVVQKNSIRFPNTVVPFVRGRVGIVVRRAGATQFTEDYDVSRNSVRRAHYAMWLVGVGAGKASRNDFRGCGSSSVDVTGGAGFGDNGGAVRVNLLSSACQTVFTDNDFRGLASPVGVPAVVLLPVGDACNEMDNPGNRTDRGRAVFGGQAQ